MILAMPDSRLVLTLSKKMKYATASDNTAEMSTAPAAVSLTVFALGWYIPTSISISTSTAVLNNSQIMTSAIVMQTIRNSALVRS